MIFIYANEPETQFKPNNKRGWARSGLYGNNSRIHSAYMCTRISRIRVCCPSYGNKLLMLMEVENAAPAIAKGVPGSG